MVALHRTNTVEEMKAESAMLLREVELSKLAAVTQSIAFENKVVLFYHPGDLELFQTIQAFKASHPDLAEFAILQEYARTPKSDAMIKILHNHAASAVLKYKINLPSKQLNILKEKKQKEELVELANGLRGRHLVELLLKGLYLVLEADQGRPAH
ncbi:hypothetical protein HDU91_004420 [Kappamyces sp. JEL0680]|nr:hypothetical protein HDU91_004420 [Kappamyces sp. JEL0680]